KNLVRADLRFTHVAMNHIAEPAKRTDPERLYETLLHTIGQFVITHEPQRVVPERVDLDGLALARSECDAVAFGVHPCELRGRIALRDQAVIWVHLDVIPRAAAVTLDDVTTGGKKLLLECRVVLTGFQIFETSMDKPEAGID